MAESGVRCAYFVAVTPARAERLSKDAVLVVSDAFVLEKPRKRVFATMMSTAPPAELDAKLRERRALMAERRGAPVILPPEPVAAARAWEAWWAKQAG